LSIAITAAAFDGGAAKPDKAAEVNGVTISAADVDAKLGNELAQLQQQVFSLRQKQLDSMIDQILLEQESKKRGVTVPALIDAEITSKVEKATSEEASKFYKENSARIPGDYKTLEDQIKKFLTSQRLQARQRDYMQTLRAAAKVNVHLTPPPVFRSEVNIAGAPSRGSADAPVTIVEFSDFHCPFCRKAQPVLQELRAKYGPKLRFVYRDFPLDNLHPEARAASEAALCAMEQGKYWEFHERMFKGDAGTSAAALNGIAKEIGLDMAAFGACATSGKHKATVQASAEEGSRLGVTATPTFFVNGRMLMGAQPVEEFVRVIDEELAAAAPSPAAKKP
jgi:predicted DsbA family dithiol-disulfide isomerase